MAIALALGCSGCTTAMHPVPVSVLESGQTHAFRRVLVVTRDGYERDLVDAELRPDSLVGTLPDSANVRFAMPATEIVRMESEERDPAPVIHAVAGFLGDVAAGLVSGIGTILRCSF